MHRVTAGGIIIATMAMMVSNLTGRTQSRKKAFRVIAFYTAKNDPAHISFVHEANRWFPRAAAENNFTYDSTNDWTNLNEKYLSHYQVVLFLDTRPEQSMQRSAFEQYMKNGGAWIGFHFAGFDLAGSAYPSDWDWYHNEFIGTGQYKGNTWKPTPATLRVENNKHPVTRHLPDTFTSSPNEWYSWEKDLRKDPAIEILISIDSSSFPLGTGPKQYEIWHSGYYPVVWTNKNYRMLYVNMGHNDIDYANKTNKELSFQFDNAMQRRMMVNALVWLGRNKKRSGSRRD